MKLYKRGLSEFLLLTLLSFVVFLAIYASLPSLSFPYGDTWDTPVRWILQHKAYSANISGETAYGSFADFLSSLFSQHNESRKVTLKLLAFLIDPILPAFGAFWNVLSFFVRVLTILVVTYPLFSSLKKLDHFSIRRSSVYLIFYFLVGTGLFVYASGPANLWNGLWEVQTSFFLGILFAMLALSCYGKIILSFSKAGLDVERRQIHVMRNDVIQRRFFSVPSIALYAALFSWLSIFSFSGNVCIAVVCIGLIIYAILFNLRQGARLIDLVRSSVFIWSCGSLVLILLSVGLFFYGWISPPHHAPLRGGLSFDYIKFFLGNFYQFFINTNSALYLISFFPVVALGTAAVHFLVKGRQVPEVFLITGSQLIFLFGLACASSIGRSGVSVEYALEERYNSISILYGYLTLLLIYSSVTAIGFSKSLKVLFSSFVVVGMLVGVVANLKWYKQIYKKRARLMQSEQCFKRFYLTEYPPDRLPEESSGLVCSRGFYPNYEGLGAWFKKHVCSSDELLSKSKNAQLICDYQRKL